MTRYWSGSVALVLQYDSYDKLKQTPGSFLLDPEWWRKTHENNGQSAVVGACIGCEDSAGNRRFKIPHSVSAVRDVDCRRGIVTSQDPRSQSFCLCAFGVPDLEQKRLASFLFLHEENNMFLPNAPLKLIERPSTNMLFSELEKVHVANLDRVFAVSNLVWISWFGVNESAVNRIMNQHSQIFHPKHKLNIDSSFIWFGPSTPNEFPATVGEGPRGHRASSGVFALWLIENVPPREMVDLYVNIQLGE